LVKVGRHQVRKILQTAGRIEVKPLNSKTIQLEEKIHVLRTMCKEGLSMPMAAERFGVEKSKIRQWVKTAIDTHVPIRMRICGKVGE
jgi:transposase-like protein